MDPGRPKVEFALLADLERQILTRTFVSTVDVADLFDVEFIEFGRSGTVYTKTQTVAALIAQSAHPE